MDTRKLIESYKNSKTTIPQINSPSKVNSRTILKAFESGFFTPTTKFSGKDVNKWHNQVETISNKAYNYLSNTGYKKADPELLKSIEDLLSQSDDVRQYILYNRPRINDYQTVYDGFRTTEDYLKKLRDSFFGTEAEIQNYSDRIMEVAELLKKNPDSVVIGNPPKTTPKVQLPTIPTSPKDAKQGDFIPGRIKTPEAALPEEKHYVSKELYDAAVKFNEEYDKAMAESEKAERNQKRKNLLIAFNAKNGVVMGDDPRLSDLLDPNDPMLGTVGQAIKEFGAAPKAESEEELGVLDEAKKQKILGEIIRFDNFQKEKGIKNSPIFNLNDKTLITTPDGTEIKNNYSLYKYGQSERRTNVENKAIEDITKNFWVLDDIKEIASTFASKEFAAQKKIDANTFNIINGHKTADLWEDDYKYSKLEDGEKMIYNYLVLKQTAEIKQDMAEEYLYSLNDVLEQRAALDRSNSMNGFEKSAYITGQSITGAAENILKLPYRAAGKSMNMPGDRFGEGLDRTYGANFGENISDAIIKYETNGYAKGWYSLVKTIGDQIPAIVAAKIAGPVGAAAAYSTTLSANVISQSVREAVQNNKSLKSGLVYGAIESAMEIALDRMLGGIGGKFLGKGSSSVVVKVLNKIDDVITYKFPRSLLKGFVARVETSAGEWVQEFLQGITEPAIRNVIYSEANVYNEKTLEEALNQALIGFFSGFVLGGGANAAQTTAYYETLGDSLSDSQVLEFAKEAGNVKSELYRELSEKARKGKELTAAERGMLSKETTDLVYNNATFTKETLKFMATEGSVKQISDVLFGGNTEAAEIFKEKFSDSEYVDSLMFGENDRVDASFVEKALNPTVPETDATEAMAEGQTAPTAEGEATAEAETVGTETEAPTDSIAHPAPTAGKVLKMTPVSAKAKNFVKDIAKRLGTNLEFVDMAAELAKRGQNIEGLVIYPEGFYDPDTHTLYVGNEVSNPVEFVFKHELTHYGERSKYYADFARAVRDSKALKKWLDTQATYTAKDTAGKELELHLILKERYKEVKNLTEPEAQREVIANFVADVLFKGDVETLSEILNEATPTQKNAVMRFLSDFFSWLKSKFTGSKQIVSEIADLENMFRELIDDATVNPMPTEAGITYDTAETKANESMSVPASEGAVNEKTTEEVGGGLSYSIVTLDSGKSYVQASRKVILGKTVAEWRKEITSFFNESLKNGPIEIKTVEGDVLTITKDTADKARDRNISENGNTRKLSDQEFLVKLDAVSHIDELAEISRRTNQPTAPDLKNHEFAKDGFSYRTVYFQDFDGSYYRITLSIGENNGVSTVYNVGKIKTEDIPNGNIVSAIGSKADMSSARFSIPESSQNVKEKVNEATEEVGVELDEKTESVSPLSFSVPASEGKAVTSKSLFDKVQNGEITYEEFERLVNEGWSEAGKTYGVKPEGEMVTANNKPQNVPNKVAPDKTVRRFVRNVLEANYSKDFNNALKSETLAKNKGTVYEVQSNKDLAERARKKIALQNIRTAQENWLKNTDRINPEKIAIGESLLVMAEQEGRIEDGVQLASELAIMFTTAGQVVQAAKLFKRLGSIGKLIYLQKTVNKLNRHIEKRYKNADPLVLNETLAAQLLETKTEEEAELVLDAIKAELGQQMPSNWIDKWNAWRYMSMLVNPTTHIRNFYGNLLFKPAIAMSEALSATIQSGVGAAQRARGKEFEKTTTFKANKRDKDFAAKDWTKNRKKVMNSGKYEDVSDIEENRRIYKNDILEGIRKGNSNLLEWEDGIFLKNHYIRTLARYLTANKINPETASEAQLDRARKYAIKKAQEYTYRDASKVANWLAKTSHNHKVADIFFGGLIPFKKTPINVLKRGIEYSPLGFIKSLVDYGTKVRKGDMTVGEFIDGLAAATTGTGLFIIGALLSNLGVLKGDFEDDDKWFEKLRGHQEYSIELFGASYTINWAAPSSIPMFMGAAFSSFQPDEDGNWFDNLLSMGASGLEPVLELTMLQGVNDALDAASYAEDNEKLWTLGGNILTSYATQGLPTIGGKIANVIDDTRRTKYIDPSKGSVTLQTMWDTFSKKVPLLSMTRAEYIDAWGREEHTGNVVERFFSQFVSPGYASTVDPDPIYDELKAIKEATGEAGVYPEAPRKHITVGGDRRNLTKEEYYDVATMSGQTKMNLVNEAMDHKYYDKLTDEQKADVIMNIYKYANKLAVVSELDFTLDEIKAGLGDKGDVLTESRWNGFSFEQQQYLTHEAFMDGVITAYKYEQNGGSAAEYFILKALRDR